MAILGFTLGILELIFFSGFFILMLVGVSLDRRGQEGQKWWFLFALIAISVVVFWSDFTFSGAFDFARSAALWVPVSYYLLFGLGYSVLEFILSVRKAAKSYKVSWENYLKNHVATIYSSPRKQIKLHELLEKVKLHANATFDPYEKLEAEAVTEAIRSYAANAHTREGFMDLEPIDGLPQPKILKARLAEYIGVWTFFWPFYLLTLVFNDFLTELFNQITEFFVMISGRFVKAVFKDVFKI